ncbi:MAG: hypothetical protein AAFQ76_17480, partial [Cyanobacteria bacterium J06626_26]
YAKNAALLLLDQMMPISSGTVVLNRVSQKRNLYYSRQSGKNLEKTCQESNQKTSDSYETSQETSDISAGTA